MRAISVQPATRHATKVVPDGNYVYVADGEGGLYVLRLLDKAVYLPIIMLR
jgi:hypothetical protein